ncbi:MAG: hypothetical protein JW864_17965 [Spirochaetes bacterium]|nr:hypothetical protein [Spirochaetota bacterium]
MEADYLIRKYDEMMASVGNHLYEAECLLTLFMKNMAELYHDTILDLEMELPENGSDSAVVLKRILWNDAARCIELEAENEKVDYPVNWDSLTISTKNLIANYIHLKLLSDGIYGHIRN